MIRAADKILDIGPGAGEWGGQILYDGPLDGLDGQATPHRRIPARPITPRRWPRAPANRAAGSPSGTRAATTSRTSPSSFRWRVFCCVTGVSGSGKTTLVRDTLCANYRRLREIAAVEAEPCAALDGLERITDLHWVDQSPLSGSSRSNPVTYVKASTSIFARRWPPRAKRARTDLAPGDFSFNIEGGRCETCKGTGRQIIDMHFMADIEVVCDQCDGKRFQRPRPAPPTQRQKHRRHPEHDRR